MASSRPGLIGAMPYRRSGQSGLHLPVMSLSIGRDFAAQRRETRNRLLEYSIDAGITHFDLNLSCLSKGVTDQIIGRILPRREQLVLSTRIGFGSSPGPLVGYGSRKYLLSSLDRLLQSTGLEYIDVCLAHRYDPNTPIEETATALADAVRQGKALYAGLSSYAPAVAYRAAEVLRDLRSPLAFCEASYSLLDRWVENGLLDVLQRQGIGFVAGAPLAHGTLVDHPTIHSHGQDPFLGDEVSALRALASMSVKRGQSLSQLAISWLLRNSRVTSVLISTRNLAHLVENYESLSGINFTPAEEGKVDESVHSLLNA